MNLVKLFELQRQLDAHIEKEHPRQEGEDRLAKKILALQVELGELCNCWRGFKFWSNNQKPHTKALRNPAMMPEDQEWYNPLLEEYVDCLHFLLSIGLESEIGTFTGDELMPIKMGTIEIQFITLFKVTVTFLEDINYYPDMWELFLGLGEMLGFTWEQIEEAYMQKNAENHARQERGY
ncbi:dimeric dUTPase (all-alpha-NTP-PPase superfamily) [Anoxybacillus kamchatkensis]|uniref:dUTP diphosphatase n=1 Tax=Anoxybacillus ayderensis TaxID=265546 RepID=UPI0015EB3BA6|nr:dUTP diphosphatase [Anoxybacillus ayderensis]MBA2878020.1 dimeric dUTPase (all-alpha-NTP-PPase superfamily) [Anoxybacillus ayderensis]